MKKLLVCALVVVGLPKMASANMDSCEKKIYENGMLRKYEYKGTTWSAATKKGGPFTSTTKVSTENTTSSVDPGVSTGESVSSSQYTSSWGECAAIDLNYAFNQRDQYIELNLLEIKKQVAMGKGYHVESLAALSECHGIDANHWNQELQSHAGEFYDSQSGESFRQVLDTVIRQDPALASSCRVRT